jgi:hypothetical protein
MRKPFTSRLHHPQKWLTRVLLPLLLVSLFPFFTRDVPIVLAAPPATATPSYFYDRETAFILNYAIDSANGGMYTAVNPDGTTIPGFMTVPVWGTPANSIRGTDKNSIGQAVCIRYLITEYQRADTLAAKIGSAAAVSGINDLLPGMANDLGDPAALLDRAKLCADFVTDKLVIPAVSQSSTANPNRLYYWGYSNQAGNGSFADDQAATGSAARSESSIPWSLAELALALKNAGRPAAEYQPYVDAAVNWWEWRRTTATALPGYGGNNTNPGIGRDIFYPALGYTLFEITGNNVYKSGPGNNADGTPIGAEPFANALLGTGVVPIMPFPASHALQDGTYTAGYGRGVIFAKNAQQSVFGGSLADRDQWWDFGLSPALAGNYPNYSVRPPTDGQFNDWNLSQPFAHYSGRELLAGTQRADWFFYTFGTNPEIFITKTTRTKRSSRLSCSVRRRLISGIIRLPSCGMTLPVLPPGTRISPARLAGEPISTDSR